MTYPSPAVADFIRGIQSLITVRRHAIAPVGFCQCEIAEAVNYAPRAQRAQLVSGIFWSVWIDQVLYYVTVDGGIPSFPANRALYEQFSQTYKFPKLLCHLTRGQASPCFLLSGGGGLPVPTKELLLEDKRDFWGEVAEFLEQSGQARTRDAALDAFREDLNLRFDPAFAYLFE